MLPYSLPHASCHPKTLGVFIAKTHTHTHIRSFNLLLYAELVRHPVSCIISLRRFSNSSNLAIFSLLLIRKQHLVAAFLAPLPVGQ